MCLAMAAVSALVLLAVPAPDRASWPYAAASGVLHIGYMFALTATYRSGDLGETYPIARGVSPALVALAAALVAGETLGLAAGIGVVLVSCGIVSLALARGGIRLGTLPAALLTGVFIAGYTVVDGIGVRHAGDPVAYTAAMSLGWCLVLPLIVVVRAGGIPPVSRRQTLSGLAGGLVSIVAYGIVIAAMQRDAMGPVSALRETSVVFAALIGWIALGERLTPRRIASCLAIALGAACLAIPG
ncbi:EamA family transporter [Methylobacterium sp. BTF04]|nr:EamA family transporter [Methylobacterium sp. BTF04]